MADELAKVGIAGAFEGALRFVGNPDLISRTHFARFLVEAGVCADTPEVFRRFLVEGKPGFVPHRWATLRDAVTWIVQAGGLAVVAHPARYKFTPTEEYALFTEFKALGGRGVEVVTGSHSGADAIRYADAAREFDLLASRGSDFQVPRKAGSISAACRSCRTTWSRSGRRWRRASTAPPEETSPGRQSWSWRNTSRSTRPIPSSGC